MAENFATKDLDERLIAEVEKRFRGVQGYYPTDRAADAWALSKHPSLQR